MRLEFEIREAQVPNATGTSDTLFEVLQLWMIRGIRRRYTRLTEPFRTREDAERWIRAQ